MTTTQKLSLAIVVSATISSVCASAQGNYWESVAWWLVAISAINYTELDIRFQKLMTLADEAAEGWKGALATNEQIRKVIESRKP